MKKKVLVSAALVGSMIALGAQAQVKPETLVKQRQSAMTLMGKYFGPLGGMAQGRVPFDATVAVRNAGYMGALVQMPWDGFDASTSGVKSAALPAVFSDPAKFKAAADALMNEVPKLAAAARSGNEANIKAAIGAVGKTCGGCHDNFRQKQ